MRFFLFPLYLFVPTLLLQKSCFGSARGWRLAYLAAVHDAEIIAGVR